MSNDYLFTSESVSEGHPDKVADQISDAILDAILAQDPRARVAAETLCNTGLVVLAGEITTHANVDYIQVARDTIKRIGYDNTDYGIDYKGCAVHGLLRQAVAGHRPGRRRRRRPRPRPGRRRPGPDVRLRLRRNRRADAGRDPLRAPPGRAPVAAAQGRPPAVAAPGRQVAGHAALRRTAARSRSTPWCCRPSTRRKCSHSADRGSGDRRDHQAGAAARMAARTPATWSTRPAASSSAARRATAA